MLYEIQHFTSYTYDVSVPISHHLARLAPLNLPTQRRLEHKVTIDPMPANSHTHQDYFGNTTLFFAMQGAHQNLKVTAHSMVEVFPYTPPSPQQTPAWEILRDACHADLLTDDSLAGEFSYASPLIKLGADFGAYAAVSFTPQRPILEAALDLNRRIFTEFQFDPAATEVATPIEEAFKKRRGVCQDFAHIYLACVRSIGLSARYVSGYLETLPPPGEAKMVGADASHAWVGVWCGQEYGWVDLDPTNNCIPAGRHIRVAHGRDFSDVSPLRGIVIGQGEQELDVAVDVTPFGEIGG